MKIYNRKIPICSVLHNISYATIFNIVHSNTSIVKNLSFHGPDKHPEN